MTFVEHVRVELFSIIKEMASISWMFEKRPMTDFSRRRKLDFESTIWCILSIGSGSLQKELLELFDFSAEIPSASALIQQRNKLLLEGFQFMFYEFN